MPPLRALFLITTKGIPELLDESKWSTEIVDFMKLCVCVDESKVISHYYYYCIFQSFNFIN